MAELASRPLVSRVVSTVGSAGPGAGRGREARLAAAAPRLPRAERAERAAPPAHRPGRRARRQRRPRRRRDRLRHAAGPGPADLLARPARGGGRRLRGGRPAAAAARPLLAVGLRAARRVARARRLDDRGGRPRSTRSSSPRTRSRASAIRQRIFFNVNAPEDLAAAETDAPGRSLLALGLQVRAASAGRLAGDGVTVTRAL